MHKSEIGEKVVTFYDSQDTFFVTSCGKQGKFFVTFYVGIVEKLRHLMPNRLKNLMTFFAAEV
jgi:hypothetical protein